jgi:DnaK suppressor protein
LAAKKKSTASASASSKTTGKTAGAARNNAASPNITNVPPDYNPAKDKNGFMNPIMKEYFRLKLIQWREELLRGSSETIQNTLQGTELQKPDLADRASAETDHALELRTRDRERKLITKINEALLRLDDGTYGYCEETGEPIGVARLDARPIATLSIEAQERHERMEKTHRDE